METEDHYIGVYYTEEPRFGQGKGNWIPISWPKYTNYVNGRSPSGLDLIHDIKVTV